MLAQHSPPGNPRPCHLCVHVWVKLAGEHFFGELEDRHVVQGRDRRRAAAVIRVRHEALRRVAPGLVVILVVLPLIELHVDLVAALCRQGRDRGRGGGKGVERVGD